MTIAIAAHEPVEKDAADAHHDLTSAVARVNAMAWLGDTAFAEFKPRWRPTEEEIVRAAITVILVALVAVMAVAAGAILTMG
ncbi:hypothetical protein A5641_19425 [Mycobacterium sp. 1554424.7]|nr:hypothetical protein A5641_19425 [Mycobacterium sp. 1554424.7]